MTGERPPATAKPSSPPSNDAALDEQQLGAFGLLNEVGRADDPLDRVIEVRLVDLHHVGREPAGPQVTTGVDDLFEELRHIWHADLGDLLAHLVRRQGRHSGYPA